MTSRVLRLFNPAAAQRLAVVSVQPAWAEKGFLINVARGNQSGKLGLAATYGPFTEEQLPEHFEQISEKLAAEGFQVSGAHSALAALQSKNVRTRALAAKRLGWQGSKAAISALLTAWNSAGDDACSILDALGRTGDSRAISICREQAARKLLSRRRSAGEALRNLNDAEGLDILWKRTLEALSPQVADALGKIDASRIDDSSVKVLLDAVKGLDKNLHGITLDYLFELGSPAALATVRAYLSEARFGKAYLWRYVKSILKRAMLRGDYVMFGWLSHRIERQSRTVKGEVVTVKSGYDGESRKTPIFLHKTRSYVRRMTWRHLRETARHRPSQYSMAVAEVLIHYASEDESLPHKLFGAFTHCYLLNQILFNGGSRLKIEPGSLRAKFRNSALVKAPTQVREERYPELWDAHPRAYLRLLGFAQLTDVQQFALRAIEREHKDLIQQASIADLLPLLGSPLEMVVKLAAEELARRFDLQNPDWPLLEYVLQDSRPAAAELARHWLQISVALWTSNAQRILSFLRTPDLLSRMQVADLANAHVDKHDDVRRTLAREILAMLESPEPAPQAFEAYVQLARGALAQDIDRLVDLEKILVLLSHASNSVKSVAAVMLARHPEYAARLGLERLIALAQHELALVRSASQALLRTAEDFWSKDPSVLLVLAESNWPDTRNMAFELLVHRIDAQSIGFDGLIGLLDSNRPDVHDIGKEMALRQLEKLDVVDLLGRLIQHPHRNARWFAMDLIEKHLPHGVESLKKLGPFCRAAMLDLQPQRKLKDRLIAFFVLRGSCDAAHAVASTEILAGFLRKQGLADFELLLDALVRIKIAFPETPSPVSLPPFVEEVG